MWRVIVFTVAAVIILGGIGFLLVFLGWSLHEKADQGEGLNGMMGADLTKRAAILLRDIAHPVSLDDDLTMISNSHEKRINEWLTAFNKVKGTK